MPKSNFFNSYLPKLIHADEQWAQPNKEISKADIRRHTGIAFGKPVTHPSYLLDRSDRLAQLFVQAALPNGEELGHSGGAQTPNCALDARGFPSF